MRTNTSCVVNKSNLAIGIVNSKKQKRQPGVLLIDKDCTVVTNGSVLVKVSKVKSDSKYIVESRDAISVSSRIDNKAGIAVVKKAKDKNKIRITTNNVLEESFTLDVMDGAYRDYKYHDYNELIKDCIKPKNLKYSVDFNPEHMEQVCKLAKGVLRDDYKLVTMEYYGEGEPLVLKCRNENTGQESIALIAQLTNGG